MIGEKLKLQSKHNLKPIVNFSEGEIYVETEIRATSQDLSKESIFNKTTVDDKKQNQRNSLFKTSFPLIAKHKENHTRSSLNYDVVNKHYCPYCEHCNIMKDQNLENHMHSLAQANVIINKGFDFIVQNLKYFDKSAIDLFSFSEMTIEDIIKDDRVAPKEKAANDINEDVIEVIFTLIF